METTPTVAQVQQAWTEERDRLTTENNRLEMQCFAQGKLISTLQIENKESAARQEATEKKLITLRYHAERLLHAHHHGNGLQAWHDLVDKLEQAIEQSK